MMVWWFIGGSATKTPRSRKLVRKRHLPRLTVRPGETARACTRGWQADQLASELTSTRTPGPMLELSDTFCT